MNRTFGPNRPDPSNAIFMPRRAGRGEPADRPLSTSATDAAVAPKRSCEAADAFGEGSFAVSDGLGSV